MEKNLAIDIRIKHTLYLEHENLNFTRLIKVNRIKYKTKDMPIYLWLMSRFCKIFCNVAEDYKVRE